MRLHCEWKKNKKLKVFWLRMEDKVDNLTRAHEEKRLIHTKGKGKGESRQSNGFRKLVIPAKSTRRTKGTVTLCDCVHSGRSIWMSQIYRLERSFMGRGKGEISARNRLLWFESRVRRRINERKISRENTYHFSNFLK